MGRARWLWLLASGLCAPILVAAARIALSLVPATGEAPIQTFVSWPSGMLSFALLGVMVPVGEEIFFRGFVYRTALGLGRALAFHPDTLLLDEPLSALDRSSRRERGTEERSARTSSVDKPGT